MNCSSFERVAERYFEGKLRPDERADLVAHLDGCRECATLFEELRVVDALLLAPRRLEPVPNFTFAVMAELGALPVPAKRNVRFVSWLAGYLAVSWLAVATSFAFAAPDVRTAMSAAFHLSAQTGLDLSSIVQSTLLAGGAPSGTLGAVVLAMFALVLDAAFAVALAAVVLFVHPRLAARFAASAEAHACDAS